MDTGELYARASGAKPVRDIVERLRDVQSHYEAVVIEGATSPVLKLLRDAADEIERLRTVLIESEL